MRIIIDTEDGTVNASVSGTSYRFESSDFTDYDGFVKQVSDKTAATPEDLKKQLDQLTGRNDELQQKINLLQQQQNAIQEKIDSVITIAENKEKETGDTQWLIHQNTGGIKS